jgi:hypothetical protein
MEVCTWEKHGSVPVDGHDVSPRNVPDIPFLEKVRNIRVNESHPPTSNVDGMDFERCSALRNAIIKHKHGQRLDTNCPIFHKPHGPR